MINFPNLTAMEIMAQMPEARNVLAKHFGRERLRTGATASLKEMARGQGVDLNALTKDLTAMAKGTGIH